MKKSQRLSSLLRIKEIEEQDLAKKLAELGGLLDAEKHQLQDLQQYKVEYLSDLDSMVSQSISVSTLVNRQHFIVKLDQAVSNQQNRVDRVQQEWEKQMLEWGKKKNEISSWEDMVDSAKQVEELAKEKIAQKEIEDLHSIRRSRST